MPIEDIGEGHAISTGKVFEIRVPGSIANLGPGFDTLAVAVELYLTLTARVLPGFGDLHFHFEGGAPVGVNSIERAFHTLAQKHTVPLPSLSVDVASEIPMCSGLGSSAAATIAGLRLFSFAADRPISNEELLTAAAALEGHPDNVAAALLGGFAISYQREDGAVAAVSTPWPHTIRFLVLTPRAELATSLARSVVPVEFSSKDAITNLQRVAMLVWAITTGNPGHLRQAMYDRLHQPYRQALVPGLADLLQFEHPHVLGVCLSGAGPSLVALVEAQHVGEVRRALEASYLRAGLAFTIRELAAHQQ